MKLHQPVMFVGLGGSGCAIGAELERRLREDLCGPDGAELIRLRPNAGLSRYQLPSCLQFVYADVNQAELDRLPLRSVPGEEHLPAVGPTAHYVRDLLPKMNTYPDVAANLRLTSDRYVRSWLPPVPGEPRVAPLSRGAGQLPTVGRAALFETLRQGTSAALHDLETAVGRLSKSGEDLQVLGGKLPQAVDVFVAFSVAGGTGAGIFYDYLHLIGEALRRSNLRVKIYPLVVMPSAFPSGSGGGRPAQLNSGRALLDLFRLIDQQNSWTTNRDLTSYDPLGGPRGDRELASVEYPGLPPIVLPPSTVQTAFLFSLPSGADRSDLHRSVVALVLSLIGTELTQTTDTTQHQSFADSFINAGVEREVPAANGIGNRGVSTAQVASLTVPVDDLSDLVAGRLMHTAVEELANPWNGVPEVNRAHIEEFFTEAGIRTVLERAVPPFGEPVPVTGAAQVTAALRDRGDAMKSALRDLQARLGHDVPQSVGGFDPRGAVQRLLTGLDPFRVERVLFGHPKLSREAERGGAAGLMSRLRQSPPSGPGSPPPVPPLKDRMLRKVRWDDPEVTAAREQQDAWFTARVRATWAQAWDDQGPAWSRPMEQTRVRVARLTTALSEHTRSDRDRFKSRSEDLARPRVGVSYLLPLGGGDMEQFYERVVNAMIEQRAEAGTLRPSASPADLFLSMMSRTRWERTYQEAVEGQPARAVAWLRDQLKEDVRRFLQSVGPRGITILPPLRDRLAQAGGLTESRVDDADVQEFRGKLAGLVPAGFAPQGTGRMKVLIVYPAATANNRIEQFLRGSLNLPVGQDVDVEWRANDAESLSVVMFRYGMGVTEVEEVREVLRIWAQALSTERPEDFLKWRQRTGYDFGYLATREEHRVLILHHLLCALWNGRFRTDTDPASPRRVSVTLGGDVTMHLPLYGLDRASSWAHLVRAYEIGALEDDSDLRRNFCLTLMEELPNGLSENGSPPDPLYRTVIDLAPGQIALLDEVIATVPASTRIRAEQLRQFWAETLPAARNLEFSRSTVYRANLAALEAEHLGRVVHLERAEHLEREL